MANNAKLFQNSFIVQVIGLASQQINHCLILCSEKAIIQIIRKFGRTHCGSNFVCRASEICELNCFLLTNKGGFQWNEIYERISEIKFKFKVSTAATLARKQNYSAE